LRSLNLLVLTILFVALGLGNLIVTANRSLIPQTIDAEVAILDIKREKHPGIDDVHFMTLTTGETLHVDKSVAEKLQVGMPIRKQAWEHKLMTEKEQISLEYSKDFRGMMWVMPLSFLVAFAVLIWPRLWLIATRTKEL
jgi:hypothetical protein